MSARETILLNYPETGDVGTLSHLLNLYGHELANRIRRLRNSCAYDENSVEYRHMTSCADLVDHEWRVQHEQRH